MNFSQKLGLFILILISLTYLYISFFNKNISLPEISFPKEETPIYNPLETPKAETKNDLKPDNSPRTVKIFIIDKSANLRSVNRTCDPTIEKSCFDYAIKELVNAPTKWEKSKGFSSEIPQGTKVLSVREGENSIMIDLSSNFEAGGGTESTVYRIKQIIKTAKANTSLPVYLYINGKQANVVGGEGLMIKQPLNEGSIDG